MSDVKVDVFNIFSFRQAALDPPSYHARIKKFVDEVVFAEELGYDTYWFAEHHFQKEGWEIVPNPLMLAANIAARTERIRLGTASVIVPQWHPIRLAEDAALVDQLSGGRLDLGVGRGYNPRELDGFGVPLDEAGNRAIFDETVEVLKRAWTEDSFSHAGARFRFPAGHGPEPEITVLPKPLQVPHPPLWQTVYSPASAESAARNRRKILMTFSSDQYMATIVNIYREAAEKAGWTPGPDDICLGPPTYVGETDAHAREVTEDYLVGFGRFFGGFGFGAVVARPGETPPDDISYDYMVERSAVISGGPETVLDRVKALMELTGVSRYLLFLLGEDDDNRRDCLQRFAQKVRPQL